MKKLDKICKSMNKINEDYVCFSKDFAFVIDGQSTKEEGNYITKWYVKYFAKELKKNISNISLLDSVNKTIKNMNTIFSSAFPKEKVPSLSLALVRERNEKVEVLIVGNAKCLIKHKRVEIIEDNRMDKFEENVLRKVRILSEEEKITFQSARSRINNILKEKRKEGAFSSFKIINGKKLTESDVVYKEFDYKKVLTAIICTDGFYAYKDYLLIKDKDLYELVCNQGLKVCYNHIRRMETKDRRLKSFPRLKLYDDASALYVSFY